MDFTQKELQFLETLLSLLQLKEDAATARIRISALDKIENALQKKIKKPEKKPGRKGK